MDSTHREHFTVRSYEVDPDGRLRLVVLVRMLQEAAWQHAHILGKGFHHREEGALFWVLSRLRLHIDRYPRWGDAFTVRTYPVGTEKLFAVREFALHDEADEIIARATSGWLVVDGGRGRPVRPERVVSDLVLADREFPADLDRAADPPTADSPTADHVRAVGPQPVRYRDIDQYRHVNNASYLEWVLDAADPDRAMTACVSDLAIDFLKETLLGDTYTVRLQSDSSQPGPTDHFEITRGPTGEPAVRGTLTWHPRAT
ncbi:MAG: acyl-[acyl-carrier-protein] thioesterase [Spirochaetota bacterium]